MVFAGFVCHQLIMAALLHNLTAVKHGDLIAEPAGGKPVADINGGFVPDDLIKVGVNLRFRHRVKGGGGFVKPQ